MGNRCSSCNKFTTLGGAELHAGTLSDKVAASSMDDLT
jgi:hypothetical protein